MSEVPAMVSRISIKPLFAWMIFALALAVAPARFVPHLPADDSLTQSVYLWSDS